MQIIVSFNYVMNENEISNKRGFKGISKDENAVPLQMNPAQFQKMAFLYNALQDGWTIKKQDNSYIFRKKHEGKQEVFLDTYLNTFVKSNLDICSLLSSSSNKIE